MTLVPSRSEPTWRSRAKSPEVSFAVTCWGHDLGPFEVGADLEVTCQVSGGEFFVTCWVRDLGSYEVTWSTWRSRAKSPEVSFAVTCWGHDLGSFEVTWPTWRSGVKSPALSVVACQGSIGQVSGLHRGVLVTYKVAGGEILLHVRSLDVSFVTCQVFGGWGYVSGFREVKFCYVSCLWRRVLSCFRSPEVNFIMC
jgi:hypothetical protein